MSETLIYVKEKWSKQDKDKPSKAGYCSEAFYYEKMLPHPNDRICNTMKIPLPMEMSLTPGCVPETCDVRYLEFRVSYYKVGDERIPVWYDIRKEPTTLELPPPKDYQDLQGNWITQSEHYQLVKYRKNYNEIVKETPFDKEGNQYLVSTTWEGYYPESDEHYYRTTVYSLDRQGNVITSLNFWRTTCKKQMRDSHSQAVGLVRRSKNFKEDCDE